MLSSFLGKVFDQELFFRTKSNDFHVAGSFNEVSVAIWLTYSAGTVARLTQVPRAMFSGALQWPDVSQQGQGQGLQPGSLDRINSRSPPRRFGEYSGGYVPPADQPWRVGLDVCDNYFLEHVHDPMIKQQFSKLPLQKRKRILLDCVTKTTPIAVPEKWISACIGNWRTGEMEKQVLNGANVHRATSSPSNTHFGDRGPLGAPGHELGSLHSAGQHISYERFYAQSGVPPMPQGTGSLRAVPTGLEGSPEWAMKLVGLWPDQKSLLVTELLKLLPEDVAEMLQGLPPPSAAAVGWCACLAANVKNVPPDFYLRPWILRVMANSPPPPSIQNSAGQIPSGPGAAAEIGLIIQCIVVGLQTVPTTIMMDGIARLMTQISVLKDVQLLAPLILAADDQDGTRKSELQTMFALKPHCPAVHNFTDLEQFLLREEATFKEKSVKFVVVTGLGHHLFKGDTSLISPKKWLHGPELRWVFEMTRIGEHLKKTFGEKSTVDMCIAPDTVSPEIVEELKNLFGPVASSEHVTAGLVGNLSKLFSLPFLPSVSNCFEPKALPTVLDGWTLPTADALRGLPMSVGSLLVQTKIADMFKDRALDQVETQVLGALQMRHTANGEVRSVGRDFMLMHYAMEETPISKYFRAKLPCHETIAAVSGLKDVGKFCVPCGSVRFCRNCEFVIGSLDQGYRFDVLTSSIMSMLKKVVPLWISKEEVVDFHRSVVQDRMHSCSASCPLNPVLGK